MRAAKALFSRSNLIMHFGLLLLMAKGLLVILIGMLSLSFVNVLYFWTIWSMVSLMVDALIFSSRPKFLFIFRFTEADEKRFKINSMEIKKYLVFSPSIRFIRTGLMTLMVFLISPISNWESNLSVCLLLGFFVIDPIIRKMLNIKSPTIFKSTPAELPISTYDLHRNDAGFPGTGPWNALEANRLIKNNPHSFV